MLCTVDGEEPPPEEAQAWESLIIELSAITAVARHQNGGGVRKIQIYGKARPSPDDPKTQALPARYLEKRAGSLRRAFDQNIMPPVEIYP
jgi:histidinol dehydrogenase